MLQSIKVEVNCSAALNILRAVVQGFGIGLYTSVLIKPMKYHIYADPAQLYYSFPTESADANAPW